MKVVGIVHILFLIWGNSYGKETYTITGSVSFQYDSDIYIRVCTMEEWAEFLRPNYELSVPPWKLIKINSETRKNGEVSFNIDGIAKGMYVIVAFQDVISNHKVDYGVYI